MKKILLCLLTLFAVSIQAWFIYVLSAGGIRQFEMVWQSFGVPVPVYTVWLFARIQDQTLWLLPLACLVLGIWGAWQKKHMRSAAATGVLLLLTLALFGAVYAPAFLAGHS